MAIYNTLLLSVVSFRCHNYHSNRLRFECCVVIAAIPEDMSVTSEFYEVVWNGRVEIRQGVEMDSPVVSLVQVGSVLEIVEEVMTAAGHRRGRLADGRGWISIVDADGDTILRECMRPFVAGATVVPGEIDIKSPSIGTVQYPPVKILSDSLPSFVACYQISRLPLIQAFDYH